MFKKERKNRPDYFLAIIIFALVMFGLIVIYSVSKYYSLQITDGVTDKYYLNKQLISLLLGLVAWAIFQNIDYRHWQKNSKYMFYATFGLLLLPLLFGGSRWIGFGWAVFQPAELAKLTMIFYLAGYFADRENAREIQKSSMKFFVFVGAIALLMLVQKDLGTLSVFVGISGIMFLMAGAPYLHLFYGGGLAGFLLWLSIKIEPYRMHRLTAFLNPGEDTLGTGYHIRNALIAIGSGGVLGLGFGQSKQKYLYLPEAHTDSIFAIIAEELGFLRTSVIIIAFCLVALRGYKIAKNAPDTFSKLTAVGITSWLVWQAFVNIGAMLSIVPLTGIPLPFISYGGSSLIILLAATGVLLNISKYSTLYEKAK